MDTFAAGEKLWIDRLGNVRNLVRQELIARQLADHVTGGSHVLDVGCGQGTQAIRLAGRGYAVTGIDPSAALLQRLTADAQRAGVRVETFVGSLDDLPMLIGERAFDLVCAHGLLMYLDDAAAALQVLAARVGDGGMLSITFRNRLALAFRPGMRGQWQNALAAVRARTYVNELGLEAAAHTLDQITDSLAEIGLVVEAWYGVRLFTDPLPGDLAPPPEPELRLLLDAEYEASRRDPYRQLGAQLHVLARRRK